MARNRHRPHGETIAGGSGGVMGVCPSCGGRKPFMKDLCKKCEAADALLIPFEPKPQPAQPRPEMVSIYCITSGDLGLANIKFGLTENVEARLAGLQSGSPLELRVVGAVSARRSLERRILLHLRPHRCWGEWFRPEPPVVAFARYFERRDWEPMVVELGIRIGMRILQPDPTPRVP